MGSILIRNVRAILTMDDHRTRISGGSIYVEGPAIRAIGPSVPFETADVVIDARGMVALPGLVNCHHHLYQTLTRAVPLAQDCELFDWLVTLYEIWRHLGPEDLYLGALVGLGELLKTGCTTSADHFYVFPRGTVSDLIDWEIRAAQEVGIRFHPTRGSMSRGRSRGGLPPDEVCQSEDEILRDTRRLIETYHDPAPYAMCRVGVSPCSPFSVTEDLMRESAALARSYGVHLHTHLAETRDEETYCLETYGVRPFEYAERCGWAGPDVWFAHGIWFSDDEITRLGRHRVGIAHCPISNLKLASGVARVPSLLQAGARVGLGVDGSASSDSSNMLLEARVCHLVHQLYHGVGSLTAEDVLWLATRGGAQVLGRDDIGSLEVGKAADIVLVDVSQLAFAGALHDPALALVTCGVSQVVDTVIVNGRIVVQNGRLTTIDEEAIARQAQTASERMIREARARTGIDFWAARKRERKGSGTDQTSTGK